MSRRAATAATQLATGGERGWRVCTGRARTNHQRASRIHGVVGAALAVIESQRLKPPCLFLFPPQTPQQNNTIKVID